MKNDVNLFCGEKNETTLSKKQRKIDLLLLEVFVIFLLSPPPGTIWIFNIFLFHVILHVPAGSPHCLWQSCRFSAVLLLLNIWNIQNKTSWALMREAMMVNVTCHIRSLRRHVTTWHVGIAPSVANVTAHDIVAVVWFWDLIVWINTYLWK